MEGKDYFEKIEREIKEMPEEEFFKLAVNAGIEKEHTICFELKGNEKEIITEIKKYIPTSRKDIREWISHLENEIKKNEFLNTLFCKE